MQAGLGACGFVQGVYYFVNDQAKCKGNNVWRSIYAIK